MRKTSHLSTQLEAVEDIRKLAVSQDRLGHSRGLINLGPCVQIALLQRSKGH